VTVDELREAFLAFFEGRGHRRIPSSPLVPHGDPSLLFTSAGMVQFKPYFMGLERPPATRMTSVQKCFRTTDVEEVGDASHLTFFEMLGNFSIADYFKAEAIGWAWEFLTGVLQIDPTKLWATVYTDDDEAYGIWQSKGVPDARILRYTAEQGNFWAAGDTGPCGPCSEMHYDFGVNADCPRCAEGTCHPDVGCGRFLEIWNLVFMAYDRQPDGTLQPLPGQNIDTGAGIERVAWVLQNVGSVYETDQLRGIMRRAEEITGRAYDPDGDPEGARALRAITEHARAGAFLLFDGVLPSNEGRGYVLRRVLRRAIYFGHTIGARGSFFAQVVDAAIEASLRAHPGLAQQREYILRVVNLEESRFQQALARGLELLEQVLEREATSRVVPGRDMFVLYDTHGLPPELTVEVAGQRGYSVDREAFEAEMAAQRQRSRGEDTFADFEDSAAERFAALGLQSAFVGYEALHASATVTAILRDGVAVDRLDAGQPGEVVLDQTALYPEGGGQVGDHGQIIAADGARFLVTDTQRHGQTIVHAGSVLSGTLSVGSAVEAHVNPQRRVNSARNHTATHLLHAALRAVLGDHVRQAGSYVGPDRLRFDYTHPEATPPEVLREVQRLVNSKVRDDIVRETIELPYEQAIERGAIAFFEDRYTSNVRMVEYCEMHAHNPATGEHTAHCFSRELCGGTHLHSTGGVGMLQIVSDTSIGAGMRRIEAVTGPEAERYIEDRLELIGSLAQRFRAPVEEIPGRIDALEAQVVEERRRAETLARRASTGLADELAASAVEVGGAHLLVARVDAANVDALRALADRLRERLQSGVVVLAALIEDRPQFLAMVTDDLVTRGVRADVLVRAAASVAGGGGGGRPQLAQAGGRDASKLDAALEAARKAAHAGLTGN